VRAEGRTPEELESDLVERYRAHLRNPELSVSVRSFAGNRVSAGGRIYRSGLDDVQPTVVVRTAAPPQIFVGGEVQRPGAFAYRNGVTALQAIVEAGGQRPTAELRNVMVLRKAQTGEPVLIRRDLLADLKDPGATNDIFLQPSDVLLLPKTGIAEVAEALDQYVFQILPPIRNSSFAFIYNLRDSNGGTQFPFR
jgi:polysaccharide export outer membrane protein